tara:strand:+ start:1418 stop:1942 length:525 start_codon:yes stop_codon:yes gene_type:complete
MSEAKKIKETVMSLQKDRSNNDHFNDSVNVAIHDLLVTLDKKLLKEAFTYDIRYWEFQNNMLKIMRHQFYITYNQVLSCSDFLSQSSIDRWLQTAVAKGILTVVPDENDHRVKRYEVVNGKSLQTVVLLQLEFLNIYTKNAENFSAMATYVEELTAEYEAILKVLENTSQADIR